MPSRIGGVMDATIDGHLYPLRGNFAVTPGAVRRRGVAGQDEVHGYVEGAVGPRVQGDLVAPQGVSQLNLRRIGADPVIVKLHGERVFVVLDPRWESIDEIGDGRYEIDLRGSSCEEI